MPPSSSVKYDYKYPHLTNIDTFIPHKKRFKSTKKRLILIISKEFSLKLVRRTQEIKNYAVKISRSNHRRCFMKKAVLKNLAIFTGLQLY